jgi:hypothetical protein
VIRHDETSHDLAFDDVALHNFRHVGFGFDLIPHTFRINDHAWPLRAVIEAPGFIRTDDVFQVQPLRFLLKAGVEGLRPELGATPTGIVGAPLIRTDEDVACVTGHRRLARIIHEYRRDAFETEARQGFSHVKPTQSYW